MPVDVKLFDDLDAVESDSGGALSRAEQPILFDRLSWYRLIAEHCPPPGRLLVARAQAGKSKAWLFLAVESGKARMLASWYSLRANPVVHGADPAEAVEAIARALRKRVHSVAIAPFDAGVAEVVAGFRRGGWFVFVTPAVVSWRVATQGEDFAAYWAKRPSKLRNTAQRKAKAAGLEIEIVRHFDPAAWAAYEEIYEASWKPDEGSPAFLRALAVQEGEAGTLRLGLARKDGRPLAAQLWLVENRAATIHKLAYREDSKALSPGTVLSMAMFRAALDEDRVSKIDYGTGDDGYKRDWMEERATLWRLDAFNPASLAGLAGAARAAASALVRRLRSG